MAGCHNCGLPEHVTPGRKVELVLKAENAMRRDRKVSVWVCSDECAAQAVGLSKYGPSTKGWPVTLAQLRKLTKETNV